MQPLELYVHTGGEHGEGDHPGRVFLCRPGVDDNVAECFDTGGYAGHPRIGADEAAAHLAAAANAVGQIVAELDGKEWDSEAICTVANILRENGFPMRDTSDAFVIRGAMDGDERMYWNNADGWGDRANATVFDGDEWETIRDPIGATGRETD